MSHFFLYRVHILAYVYTKPAYTCGGGGGGKPLPVYSYNYKRIYRLAKLIAIIG